MKIIKVDGRNERKGVSAEGYKGLSFDDPRHIEERSFCDPHWDDPIEIEWVA